MLILKDEHAMGVLNSGNIGHLWHDFNAIDVHATDVGDPDDWTMTMTKTMDCEEIHWILSSSQAVYRFHSQTMAESFLYKGTWAGHPFHNTLYFIQVESCKRRCLREPIREAVP